MNQLEKDKEALVKARQNLDAAQCEVDRMERAVDFGRCTQCDEPLMYGEKEFCGEHPNCEKRKLTLSERLKKIDDYLPELTPQDIEKYFPEDKTPKGWVSIEEHLPAVTVGDFLNHNAIVKIIRVKDKEGNEYKNQVCDHNTWYYMAKDAGITHWWNGEETGKQKSLDALRSVQNITMDLVKILEKEHSVHFEIVSLPNCHVPRFNEEKIRLFRFNDRLFL